MGENSSSAAAGQPVVKATESLRAGRDPEEYLRFIDAVSPFVEHVLDEPFPWKEGGQVIVWMTRSEYDEAVAALGVLRD